LWTLLDGSLLLLEEPEISLVTPSRQEIPLILHRLQREKIQTQIILSTQRGLLSNPD
jgi:hypothetical protein